MNDKDLNVFVEGVMHYFSTLSKHPAAVATPFLINDINEYLSDYTGIIGISGNHKGSVFFSAPKLMLAHLLKELGLTSSQEDKLMDLVGEISNTISGNARRDFGEQFMLSTPIVLRGKSKNIQVSEIIENYVIPIVWKDLKANLIINLKS